MKYGKEEILTLCWNDHLSWHEGFRWRWLREVVGRLELRDIRFVIRGVVDWAAASMGVHGVLILSLVVLVAVLALGFVVVLIMSCFG